MIDSNDNYRKSQNAPARNHYQPLSRWWHFFHLLNQWEFFFQEKWGIHFFLKMSTPPLFILIPTPPSQFFLLRWHPVLLRTYPQVQQLKKIPSLLQVTGSINYAFLSHLLGCQRFKIIPSYWPSCFQNDSKQLCRNRGQQCYEEYRRKVVVGQIQTCARLFTSIICL